MRTVPLSGSRPDATIGLSSKSGHFTGFCGLASWSSGGLKLPWSEPPHAARNVLRLDRPSTPAAERPMNSRRPYVDSRGCSVIPNLPGLLAPHVRVNQRRGPGSIHEHDEGVDGDRG